MALEHADVVSLGELDHRHAGDARIIEEEQP
jgi:hypothetical protein